MLHSLRVLYIYLYIIVLYNVIPVTISCKSSNGGNKDKEDEACDEGTAAQMITMFYMRDLNKP